MTIRVEDEFVNHEPPSAGLPGGGFKNESPVGAKNGTPLVKLWPDDIYGAIYAILAAGGISPSGDPDTAIVSDVLAALNNIFAQLDTPNIFTASQAISNANPLFKINETDAAIDNRLWRHLADAGRLLLQVTDDAEAVSENWREVDRTGATVDSVILPNGNVLIGHTIDPGHHLIRKGSIVAAGSNIFQVESGTGVASMFVLSADSTGESAVSTVLKIRKVTATSRSINAAGTINASGADYAEYHTKTDDCGEIKAGDICGLDADGKITDVFSAAILFAIKSTNPNLVGGDSWFAEEEPMRPVLELPESPEVPVEGAKQAIIDAYNESLADHLVEVETLTNSHRVALEQHKIDLELFGGRLEKARQTVDRISYCGRTPINGIAGNPGDWVVPVDNSGAIGWVSIPNSAVTFSQFKEAVGRISAIGKDGRAIVSVGAN